MTWLRQLDLEQFLLFTLVLSRVSGLTMTAPIYGTKDVPMQVRALLAFTLALLITPTQWGLAVEYPQSTIHYMILMGSELLIGLCLGLGIVVLFGGIQLAGQMISRISGMMLADVFDPNLETSVPMFSRLLFMVTMAVFVCIGGHRIVMAGLLDTFQAVPPGSSVLPPSIAETFVVILTQSFGLGIRAAVPVVTALLLSTLVMGLISRTLPQLNILMVGFGMNALLTFAVAALTLGAAAWAFQEQIEPTLKTLLDAFDAPLRREWLS
jgi:flagellar biosynthetic protein FliR